MLFTTRFLFSSCYHRVRLVKQGLETDWTQLKEIFGKESDTESESGFSLACRDHRGKHSKNRRDSLKDKHSGIKDKCSEVIVNKQLYPHATLQQDFLWGWDGNDIEYKDLTFGLFVAGELEII